ncbi:MAG: ABC transporter permease [Ruminococcaceae bacterium]|nr:ABC transporter permease [Oscillospiraceae bacterium]
MITFAKRCGKEILRDPLNILFGIGFPLVLLLLLSAIQANIPAPLFEIEKLAPGIAVFGLSFMTLFSATLVSRDRESSFLQRLYSTPLKPSDFIIGYMLPLLPIALMQSALCFAAAAILGLPVNINILYALLLMIPTAFFYISLGLLCGSVLGVKQVGGICGALLTNLSAWLSGIWFDLELVGGLFKKIAGILPFFHAVEIEKSAISGSFSGFFGHFAFVSAYAAITALCAVFLFLKQMKNQ